MKRVSTAAMLIALTATFASGAPADDHRPQPCTGFDVLTNTWGWSYTEDLNDSVKLCPPNQVLLGVATPSRGHPPNGPGYVQGACCPLPAADILTAEETYVPFECPEGFVVTGGPVQSDRYPSTLVRCTKINTLRYRLGPTHEGNFWGESVTTAFPWKENTLLTTTALPPAISYGIRRKSRTSFAAGGCIGNPPGSLLTRAGGHHCVSYAFRALQFIDGTAVKMFPDCSGLSGIFDPNARCVPGKGDR